MCLEELFSPFNRDALNLRSSSVQVSLSSLRRVTLHTFIEQNIEHSTHLPLMPTRKDQSAQITHRQDIFYVIYLLLFAVALLCCDML